MLTGRPAFEGDGPRRGGGAGLESLARPNAVRHPADAPARFKERHTPDLFHELFLRHLHVLYIEILQHGAGGGRN